MAQCESWFKQDLKKPIKVQMLNGNLFSQDNQGNLIGVEVFDDGEPASLAGTVSANIIRADGGTVAAIGTLSGNKCSVVLPAAAYAIPGFATIVIKLTYSGAVTTLLALAVTIYRSSTDTAVDPGTVMPSIQSLIQQINTAVASIPADYSSLWTSLAPAFSTDVSYVAGQYVTNNGKVYRFNTAHAAGEWVESEVTEVKLGNEISDLKSAITTFILPFTPNMIHGRLDSDGNFIESEDRWVTQDYIPTKNLTTMNNNTSGGSTYVDYYNLTNGNYVFTQYDTTRPGDAYTFVQSQGTHVRLYSTHNSSGRNLVLNQYVEKLKTMQDSILNDLAPIHPSRYGVPNFNTVNNTFTIIHGTTIYGNGESYLISNDITVSLNGNYTSHKIVYNISTGELSDIRYNADVPDGYLLIALYSHPEKSPTISCQYTIDGILYGIDVDYAIRTELAPIHPSRYGVPNFDTVNNTFTLPKQSTIYHGDEYYTNADDISCSLSSYTSHKIVYNISTGELSDIRYSAVIPIGSVLLALYTSVGKTAAISCPYAVDGNVFDIDLNDAKTITYNIKSVNHRGYNAEYPENTLIAFKESKRHGFEWIETDVQYTSDNIPVIIHDPTINRTARNADGTELQSTINIYDITYEQALEYDFGIWKGSQFAGTKIPTFEECIALCRNIGLKVRIELKDETVTTARIPGLIAIIEKYGMKDFVEFASFEHSLIDYINQNNHSYAIAYIQSRYSATLLSEVQAIMGTRDDFTVSMKTGEDVNTDANLALIQETGAKIDLFTISVSGESAIMAANTRASSFTTNKINVGAYLYGYYMS